MLRKELLSYTVADVGLVLSAIYRTSDTVPEVCVRRIVVASILTAADGVIQLPV